MNDEQKRVCIWTRQFDCHFSILCQSGMRANGNFKPDKGLTSTKWDFKFCPYCGGEIEINYVEEAPDE